MDKENNAIFITAIISAVVLIVAVVGITTFKQTSSPDYEDTVNVEGIATIKSMPDLVGVYFTIETKAETAQEAKNANSEILNKLISDLTSSEGFEREDIATENFNVFENYNWKDGERENDGFKATHQVSVKVNATDSARIGRVVDIGVDAGAGISYINYELSQESQNKYKAEAMKLAAKDARVKADSVALGFEKKLGDLVSVQVSDFNYYPWRAYGGMMDEGASLKSAVSNIQPSEQEVTARISATFKLK